MTPRRRGSVVVRKTRPMLAVEIARALGRPTLWEAKHLRNLSRASLLSIGRAVVPGFRETEQHE